MITEPIIFNYRTDNDSTVPKDLLDLPKVTLLVNPTTLVINWKKIITRTRTKSRIVSLNWGLEPINFSYTGQTGNLYPGNITTQEFQDNTAEIKQLEQEVNGDQDELDRLIVDLSNPSISEDTRETLQTEYDNLEGFLLSNKDTLANLRSSISAPTSLLGEVTHTQLIELSPKYQRFKELQRLFEDSKNINSLMKVQYRDYIFEGYFENFGFTDDGNQPWNRSYTIAFTILNWDRQFTASSSEIVLVQE